MMFNPKTHILCVIWDRSRRGETRVYPCSCKTHQLTKEFNVNRLHVLNFQSTKHT
ncbi:hypothetical protein HanIR_Chr14g0710921 [Helianthus annuus]|nr:hypothetical protein HanIR_Chr14g0710921 [Helianthus annuus]